MTFMVYLSILAIAIFTFTIKQTIKKVLHKDKVTMYIAIDLICSLFVILTIILLNL